MEDGLILIERNNQSTLVALTMVKIRKRQRIKAGQQLQDADVEASRLETLYREAIESEQTAQIELDAAIEREVRD